MLREAAIYETLPIEIVVVELTRENIVPLQEYIQATDYVRFSNGQVTYRKNGKMILAARIGDYFILRQGSRAQRIDPQILAQNYRLK